MTRRRYRYNPDTKRCEEVAPDWEPAERRAPVATEALTYANLRTADGVDVSSRRKHREHMKAHDVALVDDFKDSWARAAKERAEGTPEEHRERRDDIGRAAYQLQQQKRRR